MTAKYRKGFVQRDSVEREEYAKVPSASPAEGKKETVQSSYWRVAGSAILNRSVTNEKLALAGYYDFPAQYEQIRKLHLCD